MKAITLRSLLPLLLVCLTIPSAFSQDDPTTMNGGSCLAMAGDGCVALAVDKRFGSGPQMVNIAPRSVFMPHSKLMVAFTGLEGDIQSLMQELQVQVESKTSRGTLLSSSAKRRSISPRAMASLTSHVLYNRRQSPYYVQPLVVGLQKSSSDSTGTADETAEPFLCAQDVIGAQSMSDAFVCAGVATKSLYGIAEALWRPKLSSSELAEVCGKAFLSALERDCLSGYGAVVYIMTQDGGIEEIELACRND
jgi:20S proteasome subunit beta 3